MLPENLEIDNVEAIAVSTGVQAFQNNELEKALLCFDKVIEISPSMYPYMWQRGLTLYYLGDAISLSLQPPPTAVLSSACALSFLPRDAVSSNTPTFNMTLVLLHDAGRYEEGAKQFRDDVAVNPNDTGLVSAPLTPFDFVSPPLVFREPSTHGVRHTYPCIAHPSARCLLGNDRGPCARKPGAR